MTKTLLTEQEWSKFMFDMNFGMARRPESAEDAMTIEGCSLKTQKRSAANRFPEDYGRLLKFTPTEVIVLSRPTRVEMHEDKSLAKWVGTKEEYYQMWDCD